MLTVDKPCISTENLDHYTVRTTELIVCKKEIMSFFSSLPSVCKEVYNKCFTEKKNFALKHPESSPAMVQFLDESNSPCEQPKAGCTQRRRN